MKILSEFSKTMKMPNSTLRIVIIVGFVAAFILLLPLLAMQITDEMVWSLFDFAAAWILLFGAGLTYKLIARKTKNKAYRTAVGIAVSTALLIVWANLAVGIIGTEDNPANWMFVGVLAVGIIGAIIARFQPYGMSLALFATALAHALVVVIALIARLDDQVSGPIEIVIPNLFFIVLWVGAARLFRNASRRQAVV